MKAPIIQWVTPTETVPCTLITQEGERKGFCEKGVIKELGNVVQFERIGFVKIDAVSNDGVRAYFTHK
jgi:glutamyl-tRNA synthetase